jgi:hypothetical protein
MAQLGSNSAWRLILLRDLLVPAAMVGSSRGDFSADNRSKAAAHHGGSHVDVNDETADRGRRGCDVDEDREIASTRYTNRYWLSERGRKFSGSRPDETQDQ